MIKPPWDQAPKWAQYLAMDADGHWFWHPYKPNQSDSEWLTSTWDETLEQRPIAEQEFERRMREAEATAQDAADMWP